MKLIEIQRFRSPWLWAILILVNLPVQALGLRQLFGGMTIGDQPAPDGVMIFIMLIPLTILLLFLCTYLKISYDEERLEIRYFPFQTRQFSYADIEEMKIITYSPFLDYGGWGIRWNFDSWAYIVTGNQGISLKMKNGKKYLIGIQNVAMYQEMIENFNRRD